MPLENEGSTVALPPEARGLASVYEMPINQATASGERGSLAAYSNRQALQAGTLKSARRPCVGFVGGIGFALDRSSLNETISARFAGEFYAPTIHEHVDNRNNIKGN